MVNFQDILLRRKYNSNSSMLRSSRLNLDTNNLSEIKEESQQKEHSYSFNKDISNYFNNISGIASDRSMNGSYNIFILDNNHIVIDQKNKFEHITFHQSSGRKNMRTCRFCLIIKVNRSV